jgi:hypothetical protein
MAQRSLVLAVVIGLTFSLGVAGLGGAASARGQASGGARIELHKAVCPAGYSGSDYFADCFDTPGEGFEFVLDGPDGGQQVTTDANGFAAFEGIATAGTYTVVEAMADADFVVFCTRFAGTEPIPVIPVDGGIALDVALDDDLRCDWYTIPPDQGGGVGPPTDKAQCKQDGWQDFDTPRRFKNQGDCVSFVQTGK